MPCYFVLREFLHWRERNRKNTSWEEVRNGKLQKNIRISEFIFKILQPKPLAYPHGIKACPLQNGPSSQPPAGGHAQHTQAWLFIPGFMHHLQAYVISATGNVPRSSPACIKYSSRYTLFQAKDTKDSYDIIKWGGRPFDERTGIVA